MSDEDRINRVACIIADGFTEGNEQFHEADEMTKLRYIFASENVLRHFELFPYFPNKSPDFAQGQSKSKDETR